MSSQSSLPDAPSGRNGPREYLLAHYTDREELANRLTAGLGAMLSLLGLGVLVYQATAQGEPWRIVTSAVYGGTLVAFYILATIYHSVRKPVLRYLFRVLDHIAIFFLIAGTYTPFTLVNLRGPWGWSIFAAIWGLALAGTVFKIFTTGRLRVVAVVLYLAMGWLVVVAIKPLTEVLAPSGIAWLVAGGCAYTLGVIFYSWKSLPFSHAIWHVFVLVGSFCHFWAILKYVVPIQ